MRITSNMQTTYYDLINKDKLFDSHTHLNHKKYDKCQKKVISKLKYNVIDISIDLNSSYRSIEISKQFPNKISSCVGVDPEVYIPGSELYKDKLNIKEVESELDKLISTQRRYISMIGETGMDNYWLVKNKEKKVKNL
jgi:Tat protein secretion system quality control protein TatD with DNase activity